LERNWRSARAAASCSGARLQPEETALRGGKQGDVDHEVSILIRLGDEDRAGRAPSNVSTMIIRPPQHGHRCAGEGVSASVSASADGRSGEASDWRTRSMLCARHSERLNGASGVEGALINERGEIAEEGEAPGRMQGREAFEEEAAEQGVGCVRCCWFTDCSPLERYPNALNRWDSDGV
jgi:hypothetical protein